MEWNGMEWNGMEGNSNAVKKAIKLKRNQLMPNPSASSNIFGPCSNIFDCVQYFLNVFKYF